MESSNENPVVLHRSYTKFIRIVQMMLCLLCLAIAIFLWMTLYTLTSAVIILFATSFAFFIVTTVDVMASVNNRQYTIYVWIVMAYTAAFMFFLCFGCMILQMAAIPIMVAVSNCVTGIVFLIDGIIILTRASKLTPPNRIRPAAQDPEQGIQNTQTDDEIIEPTFQTKTITPSSAVGPRKSASFPVTSYGGTFPVGKNETPLPTPPELTSFEPRKSSKISQTTRDESVGMPQFAYQNYGPRKNDASLQTRSLGEKTVESFSFNSGKNDKNAGIVQDPVMVGKGIQVYPPQCLECCGRLSNIEEEGSSFDEKSSKSANSQEKTRKSREVRTCRCHEKTDKINEKNSNSISVETQSSNEKSHQRDSVKEIYSGKNARERRSTMLSRSGVVIADISSTSVNEETIPPRRVTKLWDVFAKRSKRHTENLDNESETLELSFTTTTQVNPEDFRTQNSRSRERVDKVYPSRTIESVTVQADFSGKPPNRDAISSQNDHHHDDVAERRPTIDYLLENQLIPARRPRSTVVSQKSGAETLLKYRETQKMSQISSDRSSAAKTATESALDEVRAVIRSSGIGTAPDSSHPSYDVVSRTSMTPQETFNTQISLKSWRPYSDDADVPTTDSGGMDSNSPVLKHTKTSYVPSILDNSKKTSTSTTTTAPRRPSFISFTEPEVSNDKDKSSKPKLDTIKETQEPKAKIEPEKRRKIPKSATGTTGSKATPLEERKRRRSAGSVSVPAAPYFEPRTFFVKPISPPNKCICKCICTSNPQPTKRYHVYPLEQQPYHPKDNFRLPFKSFQLEDNNFSKKNDIPACLDTQEDNQEETREKRSQYPHTLNSDEENSIEHEKPENQSNRDLDPRIIQKIRQIEEVDENQKLSGQISEYSEDDINIQKYPIFFKDNKDVDNQDRSRTTTKYPESNTETRKSSTIPDSPERETMESPKTSPEIDTGTQTLPSCPELETGKRSPDSPSDLKTGTGERQIESPSSPETQFLGTDSLECIPECVRTGMGINEPKCSPQCPHLRKEEGTETEPGASFNCLPTCSYYLKNLEKGTETEGEGVGSFRCLPHCPFYLEHPENRTGTEKIFNCSPNCTMRRKKILRNDETKDESSARMGVKRLHSGEKK